MLPLPQSSRKLRIVEVDEFAERLERVRKRFAAALGGKIADNFAALPKLCGAGADAIETTIVVHRRLHKMCGIAPTLGFSATGQAARSAEMIVREPARTRRALTPDELSALTTRLDALRDAAHSEI